MSDYQRWEPLDDSTMRQSAEGGWVLIGDYSCLKHEAHILGIEYQNLQSENARLKAEVERLDHQVRYWRIEAEVDNARWLRCLQDLEELRASSFVTAVPVEQYERVVKAGDAMADEIIGCYKAEGYDPADSETLPKWNAAKEGKPSV